MSITKAGPGTRKAGIAKAIKVIKTDCRIARVYRDGDKTCAIGALAVAAKIPLPAKKHNDQRIGSTALNGFRYRLMNHYSLSEYDLMRIQGLNDAGQTMTERRRWIAGYLKVVRDAQ